VAVSMMSARTTGLGLLLLSGCMYKVPVRVEPASATLRVGQRAEVAAPALVRVRPARATRLVAAAPGYRDYPLVLRWSPFRALFGAPTVDLRLVEEHGHAGEADLR
jgi:hypothetical protein